MLKNIKLTMFLIIVSVLVTKICLANEEEKKNEINKHPDILFEKSDYDFGEIFRGEKVEHIYKFKNNGNGALMISKVKTSCGCTGAVISSEIIPQNSYGEIKVTFNSKPVKGKITKDILVSSNDPDSPTYKLTISGNVIEEVVANPRKLNFTELLYGTGAKQDLSIKSIADPGFEISKVESNRPDVVTTLKKDKEKNEYIVTASIKKDAKQGMINGKLIIHTNSKNMKKVTVPFFGRVMGDLSVYPPRISCGIVKLKEEKKVVVFATAYNKDVMVKQVAITPDFLDAEISEMKEKKMTYKISVTLKDSAPAGRFTGDLKIFTSSKNEPVIDVPVYGMVKEG